MDNNFNDFLQQEVFTNDFEERIEYEDITQEEIARKYDQGGVVIESQVECTRSHAIPPLYQHCLFSITKRFNTLATSKNNEQIENLIAAIKALPDNITKALLPQLTFTALKRYYGDEIWNFFSNPTKETIPPLLSSMKQEEDMMRYLYEYAPENSYLPEQQDKILLNVYEDVPEQCLGTKKVEYAPEAIICGFDYAKPKINLDYETPLGPVVTKEEFAKRWSEFTYGLLDQLDWSNCFAAGGSVLASLRPLKNYDEDNGDIDIYLIGLDKEGAMNKLRHIWNVLSQKLGNRKLNVVKTKNTFTFFADLPFRPIQVVTGLYKSATEVLCSFDLDCITVGYNGNHVLALPRFVLSMATALNFLDSDMNLSNKLQYTRLAKYDDRGFSTCLPYTLRCHGLGGLDCDLPDDPREGMPSNVHKMVELMSLAKVVLLSRALYKFKFARLVSKPIAWNLRWQKGISVGTMRWSLLEIDALKRARAKVDVLSNYTKLRDLAVLTVDQLEKFWVEAPCYESIEIRLDRYTDDYYIEKFQKQNLPVSSTLSEFEKILKDAVFSSYASSMLQCFYLDICVPCEKTNKFDLNDTVRSSDAPLSPQPNFQKRKINRQMIDVNSSLAQLVYEYHSVDFSVQGLDALWINKSFDIESAPISAGKHTWKIKMDSKKDQSVVWISLVQEHNNAVGLFNNESIMKHCFANFVISIKGNQPKSNINLDGSYIFTTGSTYNKWTTFIVKNYVVPANKRSKVRKLVPEDETPHIVEFIPDNEEYIAEDGKMDLTLHLQYLVPNVSVVGL